MPAHGHPHHGSDAMHLSDIDTGEAGLTRLPNTSWSHLFCFPQDVIDAKVKIQAQMAALQRDGTSPTCSMSSEEKSALQDFYFAWRQFYCRSEDGTCSSPSYSILGMCDQLNDCDDWQASLYAWQEKVSAVCHTSAPVGPPVGPPPSASSVAEIVKYVAVVAVVLGGLYVVKQTGLPRLWGGKTR